mmetsp:Transcript_8802/g.12254  ORF Transcript_8802/g.12254 Transcript_8802/m.12254 type:complete len:349 (+) Transcript_8802:80-1126(+)
MSERKKKRWFSRRRRASEYANSDDENEDGEKLLVFGGENTEEARLCFLALINYIKNRGLEKAGLFRVPGNAEAVKEASDKLDAGVSIEDILLGIGLDDDSTIDFLATLLKQWVRCRPNTILTDETRSLLSARCAAGQDDYLADIIEQNSAAGMLFSLLADVADREEMNKMSAYNLAVVFAPNLVDDPMLSVGPLIDILAKLISSIQQSRYAMPPSSLDSYSSPQSDEALTQGEEDHRISHSHYEEEQHAVPAQKPPPPPPARRKTHPDTNERPHSPPSQNRTPPPMPEHTPKDSQFHPAPPPPPPPRQKTCTNPECIARTQALEARIAALERECQNFRQQHYEEAQNY